MYLVQEAISLFIETLPLESMNPEHPMFEELYEKECQIFRLFNQMTPTELAEYRTQVSSYN
jgi:hypothetical protein